MSGTKKIKAPKIRKSLAIAFARSFAAGLIENSEVELQEVKLSEEELEVAHKELLKIAKKIEQTINYNLLDQID